MTLLLQPGPGGDSVDPFILSTVTFDSRGPCRGALRSCTPRASTTLPASALEPGARTRTPVLGVGRAVESECPECHRQLMPRLCGGLLATIPRERSRRRATSTCPRHNGHPTRLTLPTDKHAAAACYRPACLSGSRPCLPKCYDKDHQSQPALFELCSSLQW